MHSDTRLYVQRLRNLFFIGLIRINKWKRICQFCLTPKCRGTQTGSFWKLDRFYNQLGLSQQTQNRFKLKPDQIETVYKPDQNPTCDALNPPLFVS